MAHTEQINLQNITELQDFVLKHVLFKTKKSYAIRPYIFDKHFKNINAEYVYDFLMDKYSWCENKAEILNAVLFNISSPKLCSNENCNNRVKFVDKEYKKYCSVSCGAKQSYSNFSYDEMKDIKKKRNETRKKNEIEKYGCMYVQTEEFKEIAKKTKLEKYGDENYNNSKKNTETRIKNNDGVYWSEEQVKKVFCTKSKHSINEKFKYYHKDAINVDRLFDKNFIKRNFIHKTYLYKYNMMAYFNINYKSIIEVLKYLCIDFKNV